MSNGEGIFTGRDGAVEESLCYRPTPLGLFESLAHTQPARPAWVPDLPSHQARVLLEPLSQNPTPAQCDQRKPSISSNPASRYCTLS
jgi:hypothetical protein